MTGTSVIAPSPGMPRAAVNTGARLWVSSLVVAGRTVRKFARTPQLIVFTALLLMPQRVPDLGGSRASCTPYAAR